jgi:hypothetical protein
MYKKILLWIGVIIGAIILFFNRGYIMAHMTSEFRFEKYKTAEDAKVVLLKLHPVGSSVDELVETLDKAGATCKKIDRNKYKNIPKYVHLTKVIHCEYYSGFLELIRWGGSIMCKGKKIDKIGMHKEYRGF